MEMFDQEEFESVVGLIKKSPPPSVGLINAHLRTDRGSKKALDRQNIKSMKLSKEARRFTVDDPCFVRSIDLHGPDAPQLERRVEMTAVKVDGVSYKVPGKLHTFAEPDGKLVQVVRYQIGFFCSSLEVSADAFLRSILATKFMVYGYSLNQLDEAASRVSQSAELVSRIDRYVASKRLEAEEAEARKDEIEVRVADAESELSDLVGQKDSIGSEIDDLMRQRVELDAKRIAIESANVELQARLNNVQNNEDQLKQSVLALNRSISEKGQELRNIVNDRSLISDEYRDYVVEGKKQSDVYAWFLYFSIAVIALAAWQLYTGAQRILEADVDNYRQVAAMVLQRLPFAAAVSVVIAVAWKLASLFVSRIMVIHSQRLALARLLVIAKDTVYSSTDGLEISDEEKFRERIRLKLMMLRSHLTSELGEDFEYASQGRKKVDDVEEGDSEEGED